MKKHNQNGFAVFEGILILIIVVLIGVVGWFVWNNHHKTNSTSNNTSVSLTAPVAETAKINNYADCVKAGGSKTSIENETYAATKTCTTKEGYSYVIIDPSNFAKTGDKIDAPDVSSDPCVPPTTTKSSATLEYNDGTWANVDWNPNCADNTTFIYKKSDTGWKMIVKSHIFSCTTLVSAGVPSAVYPNCLSE